MRGSRTAICAPVALVACHAVVSAVGICLGKDHDIQGIDNALDLSGAKYLAAECERRVGQVSLLDPLDEIDQDVGAAPFPGMDAAEEINAGPICAAPVSDFQR